MATHLFQSMISVQPDCPTADCLRSVVTFLVLKLLMDMFRHIYNGTSSFPLLNAYSVLDPSWHSLALKVLNPMLLCIISALFISVIVSIYVLSMISLWPKSK